MNRLSRYVAVIAVAVIPLMSQVMVEHAILTGASGTAGVNGTGALGKSLGGAFSKVANGASSGVSTQASHGGSMIVLAAPAAKKGAAAEPKVVIATPSRAALEQIAPGTTRQDLIAKLGTPFFALSQSNKGSSWETITYRIYEGGNADFRLTEGKVESVQFPPAKAKPAVPVDSESAPVTPKQ